MVEMKFQTMVPAGIPEGENGSYMVEVQFQTMVPAGLPEGEDGSYMVEMQFQTMVPAGIPPVFPEPGRVLATSFLFSD